jgi:hypothetical protein
MAVYRQWLASLVLIVVVVVSASSSGTAIDINDVTSATTSVIEAPSFGHDMLKYFFMKPGMYGCLLVLLLLSLQ